MQAQFNYFYFSILLMGFFDVNPQAELGSGIAFNSCIAQVYMKK